ncbi:MAG: M10 family metallopeptidase C-terminal domain-containing protein [Hyphomicrobiales bacterium]
MSPSPAGDVNGDGFDDVIVSAHRANVDGDTDAGETYVVFGRASGFTASLDLSALHITEGFRLDGIDANDYSVSPSPRRATSMAMALMISWIGANGADPNGDSEAGETYVVLGRKPDAPVGRAGTDIAQSLAGGDFDDTLSGLGGDDHLRGHGGNDTLVGGEGADTLDGGAGADTMFGGSGDDFYVVDDAGDLVFENAGEGTDTTQALLSHRLADNVENGILGTGSWTLIGNGLANSLVGNSGDNTLSGAGGSDALSGGDGDDRLIGGRGTDTMRGGLGDDIFDFNSIKDSVRGGRRDSVLDFQRHEDDIDVRGIDAKTGIRGNQKFMDR